MNIDWSKAPYDAEAGYLGTSAAYDAWYRRDGNGQVQQICPAAGFTVWTWMGGRTDFPVGAKLRPVPKSKWTGEGLPPVGTVCECKFAGQPDSHFTRVTIRYISDKHAVLFGEVETSHNVVACVFRPIRTPEQVAAEEREKYLQEVGKLFEPREPYDSRTIGERMYDAGYRKFEIVEGE